MEGRVCDRLAIVSVLKSANERGEFVLWRKIRNWLEMDGWSFYLSYFSKLFSQKNASAQEMMWVVDFPRINFF